MDDEPGTVLAKWSIPNASRLGTLTPSARIAELSAQVQGVLVAEMNSGQMLDDVKLAIEGRCPVRFYGRMGGIVPLPEDIEPALDEMIDELGGEEPS